MWRWQFTMLLTAGLLWTLAVPALAAERVALVIGNGAYTKQPLRNPPNDAEDMAAALQRLGFTVIHERNADRRAMMDAVRRFGSRLAGAEVGLFYYAGHGIQAGGRNYLLPVKSEVDTAADLAHFALNAQWVLDKMEEGRAKLNVVILDACRNNPFRSWRRGPQDRGLVRMQEPQGTVLAYATQPGNTAEDGSGRNGTYTRHLLAHLDKPGVTIQEMFNQTALAVRDETDGEQVPWLSTSAVPEFCLAGCRDDPIVSPPPPVPDPAAEMWALVRTSDDCTEVADFLGAFPDSAYVPAARLLQRRLKCDAPVPRERRPGTVFRDCAGCPEMVVVPAGSYVMGSPSSDAGRDGDEGPQHRVTLAEPFAVGVHEVTFQEWDACVRGGGCNGYRPDDAGWGRGNRPVIYVSWNDAQAYVRWLSQETGERYRLLSESEWEYVARAGTTSPFHTGETISTDQANYDGNYVYGSGRKGVYRVRTVEVGRFPPNGFGLHDVHGNVWEWVQDCSNNSYEGAPVDGKAWERRDCRRRVVRGGSWDDGPRYLRSAYRNWFTSGSRFYSLGFRVTRTLTP